MKQQALIAPAAAAAAAVVVAVVLLMNLGCGKPVPDDKYDFVGNWGASNAELEITSTGWASWRQVKDGKTVKVSGPIKELRNDRIDIGIWFVSTSLKVSMPPYEDVGRWHMIVEGEDLIRDSGGD